MAFAWDIQDALQKLVEGSRGPVGADGIPELLRRPEPEPEPAPVEQPMPYVYQGAPTPAEAKFNVPVSPEADKLTLSEPTAAPDKPAPEPSWTERLAKRYEDELAQRDRERQLILNEWRKSKGMSYVDESGKQHEAERGLLGISGWLSDRPDFQKKMLTESLSNLNRIRFGPGAPESKMLAPDKDALEGAQMLSQLGISKMQGLQGLAGMGKELEAERVRKQLEDPESDQSFLYSNALKKIAPDVWNDMTDSGRRKISGADSMKILTELRQFGVAQSKQQSNEDIARARLLMDIAKTDRDRGTTVIRDQATGEVSLFDKKGQFIPPEEALRLAKIGHYGNIDPKAIQEYEQYVGARRAAEQAATGQPTPVAGPAGEAAPPPPARVLPTTKPSQGLRVIKPGTKDKDTERLNKDFTDAAEGVRTSSAMSAKNSAEVQRRAAQIQRVVDRGGDTTPEGMAEIAVAAASLVGASNRPPVEVIKKFTPNNWNLVRTRLEEFFTSGPKNAGQKEWVKWFNELAHRESEGAKSFLQGISQRAVASKGILLKEHEMLKSKDGSAPQFERTMKGYGLNPESFDEKGLLKPGADPRWFNNPDLDKRPAGWTPEWRIATRGDKSVWVSPEKAEALRKAKDVTVE